MLTDLLLDIYLLYFCWFLKKKTTKKKTLWPSSCVRYGLSISFLVRLFVFWYPRVVIVPCYLFLWSFRKISLPWRDKTDSTPLSGTKMAQCWTSVSSNPRLRPRNSSQVCTSLANVTQCFAYRHRQHYYYLLLYIMLSHHGSFHVHVYFIWHVAINIHRLIALTSALEIVLR